MDQEKRNNLVINGTGKASGGVFNRVEINGSGKIEERLDCIELIVNGRGDFNGDVKAQKIEIHGVTSIAGNVTTERIKMSGKTDIDGNFTAEELNIDGYITAKGDCEAEIINLRGGFTLDGLLNAGNVDIQLYGNCRVKEIGGEMITVREGHRDLRNFIKMFFKPFVTKLTTETIEGDEIHLDYTKAKVVRGKNVTIGPGCEIDLVEYQETFHQVHDATVKDSQKI